MTIPRRIMIGAFLLGISGVIFLLAYFGVRIAFILLYLWGWGSFENTRNGPEYSLSPQLLDLTVMSFNIRTAHGIEDWGQPPHLLKWGQNLEAVIKAIRSAKPDIVSLQEVAGISQARKIAAAMNMNYAYAPHGGRAGSNWGISLLSRFPIVEAKTHLISFHRGSTRISIVATLKSGLGLISAVSIHRDHRLSDGSSITNILNSVADSQGPILLIGDFNVGVQSKLLIPVLRRFLDPVETINTIGAKRVRKIGTFGPGRSDAGLRIDHIFPEKDRFTVIDVDVTEKEHWRASDHVAFFAKLRLIHKN